MSNVMRQTGNSSISLMARRLGNVYPGVQVGENQPETTLNMMAKRMGLVYPSPQVHDPKEPSNDDSLSSYGADDGNRTHVVSLEG